MIGLKSCSVPDSCCLLYVGCYTGQGSDGIYVYSFDSENGDILPLGLAAETDNPSFFAIDSSGRFLYAVNEIDTFQNSSAGALSVFKINRNSGKLKLLQQTSSLGAAPAHISLDKTGRILMVANYNGGNLVLFPIMADGLLGEHTEFIQDEGSSVNLDRQAGPHVHSIQATNDNQFVMVTDLGTDQLMVYRLDPGLGTLALVDSGIVKMIPGSGPRHMAFSPDGGFVYVINELLSTISVFSLDSGSGRLQLVQTLSALPKDFSGENTTAEIAIDAGGRLLYASNRGDNSIGVFQIDPGTGCLSPVEWVSSGGNTPRHFEIDPSGKWLLAANQNSNNIALFRVDPTSGILTETPTSIELNSPVCVRFVSIR